MKVSKPKPPKDSDDIRGLYIKLEIGSTCHPTYKSVTLTNAEFRLNADDIVRYPKTKQRLSVRDLVGVSTNGDLISLDYLEITPYFRIKKNDVKL